MANIAAGEANARVATAETTELLSESTLHVKQIAANLTEELRHLVLWPDKPLDYVRLDEDKYGYHFGAFVPSRDCPVAVISTFFEPVPSSAINDCTASAGNGTSARFRKFACHPQFQGRGIGTHLLHYAAFHCSSAGATVLWCDARLSSSKWYEKRGFVQFGGTFFKDKVEYTRMQMALQDSDNEAEGTGSCDRNLEWGLDLTSH